MASETSKPTRGQQNLPDGTVRVWSEVGATLPIPDTYGSIRFSFGHERICKSVQEEIVKTEALIDEFNEKVLEKKLKKYKRLFDQIFNEEPIKSATSVKKKGGSVQARARKKIKKGKK